jgi:AcrR family transcriptional regulator
VPALSGARKADSAPPPSGKVDGRRERSARTHKAIISALLDLVDEGNVEPSAAEIARRAGVAVRSIGQHFKSREALFLAAVEEHTRRVSPGEGSIDPDMSLEARVAAFAEVRARELELCAPVRRATSFVELGAARSPRAITRAVDAAWQRRRRELERVFARELDARPDREALASALDLLAHGRTWDTMRDALHLSPTQATAMLRRTLTAMLRG